MPRLTVLEAAQHQTRALSGTWLGSYGMACCPAHADREPSLSISPGRTAVLYHCFAGCTQTEILAALRNLRLGVSIRPTADEAAIPNRPDLRALARQIWRDALPIAGTPAERYLAWRKIENHTIGRYDPACKARTQDGKLVTLPALILPLCERGELLAIQRIFLDRATGQKSAQLGKAKRTLGNPAGAALQLGSPPAEILNMAEGFEDAASAMDIEGLDHCWAACGTERYAQINIPATVRMIRIYTQHGRPAAAAIERAREALEQGGRQLEIVPPPPGGDWNDAARLARSA